MTAPHIAVTARKRILALNGKPSTHHANEGICTKSIRRAVGVDNAPQKGKWSLLKKKT